MPGLLEKEMLRWGRHRSIALNWYRLLMAKILAWYSTVALRVDFLVVSILYILESAGALESGRKTVIDRQRSPTLYTVHPNLVEKSML